MNLKDTSIRMYNMTWTLSRGYYLTRMMKDGKRVTVRLHRFVWEQYNGKIPNGYDIHHVNGVKTDNRIENLQLISHVEHQRLHKDKWKLGVDPRVDINEYHKALRRAWREHGRTK